MQVGYVFVVSVSVSLSLCMCVYLSVQVITSVITEVFNIEDFIFGVMVHLDHIYVKFEYQGQGHLMEMLILLPGHQF